MVALAFAIMGLCYGVGSIASGWVCSKISRLYVMQGGLLILGGSCLLVGPSYLFNFPNLAYLVFIGISVNAFFGSFLVVPVTPEIL